MTITNQNSGTPNREALPDTDRQDGAIALLKAENQQLWERIKQLEAERDAYRRAAYAWALERITDEDLRRYAETEEGVPLEAFIGELEQNAKADRDA